jgi:erythromycin esterase-like protein
MNGKVGSEKLKELDKTNRSLAKQAMTAEGEEREQAIAELRQALRATFDEREAVRMNHLEQARKELNRHQEMAAQRQQNRDRIINEQLDWILKPKPRQDPPPSKN